MAYDIKNLSVCELTVILTALERLKAEAARMLESGTYDDGVPFGEPDVEYIEKQSADIDAAIKATEVAYA